MNPKPPVATQSPIYSGNTIPLRPRLRQAVKVLVESLPLIGDLFHRHYLYPRTMTACRGVYASREEAQAAVDDQGQTEYDACNEARSLEDDIRREYRHEYEDYPVLYWLRGLLRPGLRVVDLGGSTGGTFYAFDHALGLPADLSWTVSELPAAVEKGRRVAEARQEHRLGFVTALDQVAAPDILLTMGTLQYLPETLPEMLRRQPVLPPSVLVHKVPTTDGPAFWTVQNLGAAQVPYFIENRDALVQGMEALGYVLEDACNTLRSIRIPFHAEQDVHHYSGFRFQLPA